MTTLMIEELEVFQQELDQIEEFCEALQEAVASVGGKFGLYDVMLHHGPITSACLATQAGIPERLGSPGSVGAGEPARQGTKALTEDMVALSTDGLVHKLAEFINRRFVRCPG